MKNGLYKVDFRTQRGQGAGVAVLSDGQVRGGDSALIYLGTYKEEGGKFTGTVNTKRHTVGLPSVFGADDLTINLSGTVNGDNIQLTGTSPQAPGVTLNAHLVRLAA